MVTGSPLAAWAATSAPLGVVALAEIVDRRVLAR